MITILAAILTITVSIAWLACIAGFLYAVLIRDDPDQTYAMFWMILAVTATAGIAYAGAFTALTH